MAVLVLKGIRDNIRYLYVNRGARLSFEIEFIY